MIHKELKLEIHGFSEVNVFEGLGPGDGVGEGVMGGKGVCEDGLDDCLGFEGFGGLGWGGGGRRDADDVFAYFGGAICGEEDCWGGGVVRVGFWGGLLLLLGVLVCVVGRRFWGSEGVLSETDIHSLVLQRQIACPYFKLVDGLDVGACVLVCWDCVDRTLHADGQRLHLALDGEVGEFWPEVMVCD